MGPTQGNNDLPVMLFATDINALDVAVSMSLQNSGRSHNFNAIAQHRDNQDSGLLEHSDRSANICTNTWYVHVTIVNKMLFKVDTDAEV